jgi:hypothetical protein
MKAARRFTDPLRRHQKSSASASRVLYNAVAVDAHAIILTILVALPGIIPIAVSRIGMKRVVPKQAPIEPMIVPAPQPRQSQPSAIYRDQHHYALAVAQWDLECGLHEAAQRVKIRQAASIPTQPPRPTMQRYLFLVPSTFVILIASNLIHAAIYSFLFIILGLILTVAFPALKTRRNLKRRAAAVVAAVPLPFTEPLPVYRPTSGASSGARWEDYLRPDPEPEPERRDDIRVTSMKQAYEILGLKPGRITLEEVRKAWRAQIAKYHPDKVASLGEAFHPIADRKTKELNLAMEFIEQNVKRR